MATTVKGNLLNRLFNKHSNINTEKVKEPGDFWCPVCNSRDIAMVPLYLAYQAEMKKFVRALQKNQSIQNIFLYETYNIENFACSVCGANDKDRLYAIYIQEMLKQKPSSNISLLDIAPTKQLSGFLKNKSQINYRSMDLYMEEADDKADIVNMNLYEDERFDFFICSHVLEHVGNDIKAMEELYRILKKGGKGIAMVPINSGVEITLEDPYGTDIDKRWKYYGQDDHVRMYAKNDFIKRLESVGFTVDSLDIKYFSKQLFESIAVYPTSVLYIVSK